MIQQNLASIASSSDCNEQKGEVVKDLECFSHIVIDF